MSDFSCEETKVCLDSYAVPMARESVRFWPSAGRFAASYKALFMHVM